MAESMVIVRDNGGEYWRMWAITTPSKARMAQVECFTSSDLKPWHFKARGPFEMYATTGPASWTADRLIDAVKA